MAHVKTKTETESLLSQLALILSKNLVTNSFPVGKAKEPINAILKNGEKIPEVRSRNILVIGAGASHNVDSSIPLASDAISSIRSAFSEKYGEKINFFIDKKIDELTKVYKLSSTDFETQLLACSIIDKDVVTSKLSFLYNHKFPISLFYEIVAHLFKHRFIDVVINFNFDEILDNAIEEEMFDSQWRYIYSDGHCPDIDEMEKKLLYDKRLAFPVYIKPHGTISHPSTLRFTRQAYYETPSKITETLKYLLDGKTGYKNKKPLQLPINLIVAGFGLKSHEFNSILSEYLPKSRATLYYFDLFKGEKNFWRRLKDDEIKSFNSINSRLFPLNHRLYGNRSLDDWFFLLWEKIQDCFNETYKPKGISRHVIIHELFNPLMGELINGRYKKAAYFKDRTYIELAIEILSSSDGLINLRQLKESRVQKYYSLYKNEENSDMTFFSFLEGFKLKRYKKYIKDTWYYDKENIDFIESISSRFKQIASDKLKQNFINISEPSRLNVFIERLAKSKKLFLNLRFTERDNNISIFQKINTNDIINTDIKWIYRFQKFFFSKNLNPRWNLILSISETGGIFTTPGVKDYFDKSKKLMLICSYNANKPEDSDLSPKEFKRQKLLNEKLQSIKNNIVNNNGFLELRMLPFRNHNQHVVLFTYINKLKKTLKLIGGIYYGRRNMSKRVTPIHVRDEDDLKELFGVFANYWERACKDDNNDAIKKAIRDNNISDKIKHLVDVPTNKTLEELENEIIDAFCNENN